MFNGFIKVGAAVPSVRIGDCRYNVQQIENLLAQAEGNGAEIVVFPELSLTGYSCQDLFGQQLLLEEAEAALLHLLEFSHALSVVAIVGLPVASGGALFNCAAVVHRGKLIGLVPKTYLPNYKEFYEQRWFASADSLSPENCELYLCGRKVSINPLQLFETEHCCFGIELCEDLWAPTPPSGRLAMGGAELLFNLSASNELVGKNAYLRSLVTGQSARCIAGYIYAGAGYGESTQDVVYGSQAYIAENGHMLAEAIRFRLKEQLILSEIDIASLRTERRQNTTFHACASRERRCVGFKRIEIPMEESTTERFSLTRTVNPLPFVPQGEELALRCQEILSIQSEGLARRIEHTGVEAVVVGISGGLDSTLTLLVCSLAFDRLGRDHRGIIGVTMPGFGTTARTYENALALMKHIGVTIKEISIASACMQHFKDIRHNPDKHDLTYENSQARERTQILMDVANQANAFVVGTGDLSELALGWATYNGDHMSHYAVNASVPKTLVRHLVSWVADNLADDDSARILKDIISTPISPELLPATDNGDIAQRTEDLVGPYELHDFFLFHTLRYGSRPSKVFYLAKRAFAVDDAERGIKAYPSNEILKWLTVFYRRFFSQQFKRSCLPDGPKVGTCALSPRGDWRMPSDACSAAWLAECATLTANN